MKAHNLRLAVGILSLTAIVLPGCGNPEAAVATQAAQTEHTAPATLTAAPTATRTPVPPTPTATEPPGPTPSGKYEFFEVSTDQVSEDQVNVSFGYQMEDGLDLDGVQIMAQFNNQGASCNVNQFTIFSSPYAVTQPAGLVAGDMAVVMSMQDSGKCSFAGFKLMAFRVENQKPAVLYQQEFEIPFTLEKK
jgi:hypothetical protein